MRLHIEVSVSANNKWRDADGHKRWRIYLALWLNQWRAYIQRWPQDGLLTWTHGIGFNKVSGKAI